MDEISISSAVIAPRSDRRMTPAMTSAIWEIAALVDERRLPETVEDAVWIESPTARLRRGGRQDNVWLREVLDRLTGLRLSGEHRGDPWGAVLLAEWRILSGGDRVRLLIPPAAIAALRAPRTFAKVEAEAAHRLTGHGRRLYVLLADRARQRRPSWTYTVEELRVQMGVADHPTYDRFNMLRERVLAPALAQIAELGTVEVKMTAIREGRRVARIRFDWRWRSPQDAADIVAENERAAVARGRRQTTDDAPPLIVSEADERVSAAAWFEALNDDQRQLALEATPVWIDQAKSVQRRERDRILDAYRAAMATVGGEGPGGGA